MNPIRALRAKATITQAALASAAGTSQPTIAAYESGRKSPTLDTVRRLAKSVGLEASVEYYPPLTREERRSLVLHHAIARRLAEDPERFLVQARKNLGRMAAHVAGPSEVLEEWRVVLDRPLWALLPLLTDPAPWARELRQLTPFAGVLSAGERAVAYRAFAQEERRAR